MTAAKTYLCLDVGERRIGVARGDTSVKIAVPIATVEVDGYEIDSILKQYTHEGAEAIIIGYPRNQSGDPTAQTAYVESFAARLPDSLPIIFQDESLTSVLAEQYLVATKKPYTKGDIDAGAAAIILQDFLEHQ